MLAAISCIILSIILIYMLITFDFYPELSEEKSKEDIKASK